MKIVVALSVLASVVGCAGRESSTPSEPQAQTGSTAEVVPDDCPPGTALFLETNDCLEIVDRSGPIPESVPKPSLLEMRSDSSPGSTLSVSFGGGCGGSSVGAGVTFPAGAFQVYNESTALAASVYIHAGGIGNPSNPNCTIFETSTNRTEKGVEVAVNYEAGNKDFGVFDWSCTASNPCGANTSPAWVYWQSLSGLSACYKHVVWDAGGHERRYIHYVNETNKLTIPVHGNNWQNRVLVYNWCTYTFDSIYSHYYYDAAQLDCSQSNNGCDGEYGRTGWWGPILETYNPNPQPSIKESGFMSASLKDNGSYVSLSGTNTSWVAPISTWSVYHRTPNTEWGVGNSTSE